MNKSLQHETNANVFADEYRTMSRRIGRLLAGWLAFKLALFSLLLVHSRADRPRGAQPP